MATPELRGIFGQELVLVIERFALEERPKVIQWQGLTLPPGAELVEAVTSGRYRSSTNFDFSKIGKLVTQEQVGFEISFFGVDPATARDHYLSVGVIAEVFHDGEEYALNIVGVSGYSEMPVGSSVDDLLAELGEQPKGVAATHNLRGNLPYNTIAELSTIYAQSNRHFTGLTTVHEMLTCAEAHFADIEAAIVRKHPNEQYMIDLELESAIWFANAHRYNPLEPMFNVRNPAKRNPFSLNEVTGDTFCDIVRDLETMFMASDNHAHLLELYYVSLRVMGYEGEQMLRTRLRYTEDMLNRKSVFHTRAFDKYEDQVRKYLETSKTRLIASLQQELIKKGKALVDNDASTIPAPAVVENVKVTEAGEKMRHFEIETLMQAGDRVFLVIEKTDEQPVRIGATVDMTDVTFIDLTGDDGNNYSVFWCDWNKARETFVVTMEAEETIEHVTTFYSIVE